MSKEKSEEAEKTELPPETNTNKDSEKNNDISQSSQLVVTPKPTGTWQDYGLLGLIHILLFGNQSLEKKIVLHKLGENLSEAEKFRINSEVRKMLTVYLGVLAFFLAGAGVLIQDSVDKRINATTTDLNAKLKELESSVKSSLYESKQDFKESAENRAQKAIDQKSSEIKSLLEQASNSLGKSIVAKAAIEDILDKLKTRNEEAKQAVKAVNENLKQTKEKLKSSQSVQKQIENSSITIDNRIKEVTSYLDNDVSELQRKTKIAIENSEKLTDKANSARKLIESVNGRIDQVADSIRKDELFLANFTTPVGTVIAWASSKLPNKNWKICNGSELKISDFGKLYEVLEKGNIYGKNKNTFNLPDYQGYFLRGLDKDGLVDQDSKTRRNSNGSIVGPIVGSVQSDEIKRHSHAYSRLAGQQAENRRGNASVNWFVIDKKESSNSAAVGGSETRPKNVYVHWIIKVK